VMWAVDILLTLGEKIFHAFECVTKHIHADSTVCVSVDGYHCYLK